MAHNMVPEPGQHMAIVGKKGSGKTYSSLCVLHAVANSGWPILILDSKGERKFERLPAARIVTLPSQLTFTGIEIYRPDGVLNTPEYLDAVCQRAYENGHSGYIDVDEFYQLCPRPQPGMGIANCLMRGRERYIAGQRVRLSVIGVTQRPTWVPRHMFSEADKFLMHRLQILDDRKKMAEHMGEAALAPLRGHYALYYEDDMDEPTKILMKGRV